MKHMSPNSLEGTGMVYGLDARGSTPVKEIYFSFLYTVQAHSGFHPASYPMYTSGSFPEDKAAGNSN
jgi:hypothetical protein